MNIIIVKTSENRLIVREIISISDQNNLYNIEVAYNNCLDCLESDSENVESAESISIIYNGKISKYNINDGIREFFKTI